MATPNVRNSSTCLRAICLQLLFFLLTAAAVSASDILPSADNKILFPTDPLTKFNQFMKGPLQSMDFARAKLALDQIIDPSIDIEAMLRTLDMMAADIKAMLPPQVGYPEKLKAFTTWMTPRARKSKISCCLLTAYQTSMLNLCGKGILESNADST